MLYSTQSNKTNAHLRNGCISLPKWWTTRVGESTRVVDRLTRDKAWARGDPPPQGKVSNHFQQGQCTLEECISKSTEVVDYQSGESTRVVDRGLPGTRHGQEEILHRRARCPVVSWP